MACRHRPAAGDLLNNDGPTAAHSLGQPVTAPTYLIDLCVVAGLISASWPAALDVTDHPPLVSVLDGHLRQRHHAIAQRRQYKSRPPESTLHDQPPLAADACARLVECGSMQRAARVLGNTDMRVWSTITILNPWFQEPTRAAAFDALADQHDTTPDLINYGHRRDALANWSIPPDDWQALTADLAAAERPAQRSTRKPTGAIGSAGSRPSSCGLT